MNILISNDDGIESPGLHVLAETLSSLGKVTVVAPHRERSTAGHSLTLHKPLRIYDVKPGYFSVSGTPADCVFLALRHIVKNEKPDIVVSGINRGANLGNDIFYSGTVAAAREAAVFGIKSIAVSLVLGKHAPSQTHHWETAASFIKLLCPQVIKSQLKPYTVINVNVPNLPINELKGAKLSTQGVRHYSDEIAERLDPRNRKYYWIGGQYKGFENIEGSDCSVVDKGYASITPLMVDTTDYDLLENLKKWNLDFDSTSFS